MAEQVVIDARNAIPAGEPQNAYNATRERLVTLVGFSNTNGTLVDRALLTHLAIFRNGRLLAESTNKQILRNIGDYNKANPTFGNQIDSAQALILCGYAHWWRKRRARGDSMVMADMIAATPNIDNAALQAAREDLQMVDALQDRDEQTVAPLETGTKFNALLLALRVLLSGMIGAYGCAIVYLTVPTVVNPMHPIYAAWNRVPKQGAPYNSDNNWLFRLLAPVITISDYAHYLIQICGDPGRQGSPPHNHGRRGQRRELLRPAKNLEGGIGQDLYRCEHEPTVQKVVWPTQCLLSSHA